MGCIDKQTLDQTLYKVLNEAYADNVVNINNGTERAVKFDQSKITEGDIHSLFTDTYKFAEGAIDKIKKLMGTLGTKLNSFEQANLKSIKTYINAVNKPSADNIVAYNIALKELFDGQLGEHNKMLGLKGFGSVELISDDGVMNLPTARAASVIGRKYLYTQGYRFKSTPENKIPPIVVEAMYNKVGMSILESMRDEGLVELTEGNVINDFLKPDSNKRDFKEKTIKTKVVRPIISKLVTEKEWAANKDDYLNTLKGTKADTEQITVLTSIRSIIDGINTMKSPVNITLPTRVGLKEDTLIKMDHTQISFTAAYARMLFSDTPVYLNERMLPYFKFLAKSWGKSDKGFKEFLREQFGSDLDLYRSLGVTPSSLYNDDISESIYGKNLSKEAPLQDLLEQLVHLTDGDKPAALHMTYRYVRNARLHMDNSVVNAQSSKYMRYLVTGGENTVDLKNPKQRDHFIAQLLDQASSNLLSKDKLTYEMLIGREANPTLDKYLAAYKKGFIDSTNGSMQFNFITNLKGVSNPMQALDTLGAIYDFREGLKSKDGTFKTNFMTKPDATASGGTITLLSAIGSNPEILQVVQALGLLDSSKAPTLDDVYALLATKLEPLLTNDLNSVDSMISSTGSAKRDIILVQDLLNSGIYGDYKNNPKKTMRALSKDPTMTFIYNQQITGAIMTIATSITEKLTTSLYKKPTRVYIAKLLNLDPSISVTELQNMVGLKKGLIKALNEKNTVPEFLFKRLNDVVEPLIKDRKEIILSLYRELQKYHTKGGIRILPPIAVINNITTTAENVEKYGIPLAKVQNILHTTKSGNDLLTMEERDNETTSLVNTTQAVDNAILSLAMVKAAKRFGKLKNGVIPVHDELIASTEFNVIYQEEYILATKEVISRYSVEQQLLEQLRAIDRINPLVIKLEDTIFNNIKEKRDILKNLKTTPGRVFGEQELDRSDLFGSAPIKGDVTETRTKNIINKIFTEMNSGLSDVGTLEEYTRFIKTIFPESKIQKVLAHSTSNFDPTKTFKDSWLYTEPVKLTTGGDFGAVSGEGFYMFDPLKGDTWHGLEDNDITTGYMVVNTNKPLYAKANAEYLAASGVDHYSKVGSMTKTQVIPYNEQSQVVPTINRLLQNRTGYDAIIQPLARGNTEYLVFDPQAVHILGSKKDLEMFKAFKGFKAGPAIKSKTVLGTLNKLAETSNVIKKFLTTNTKVVNNKKEGFSYRTKTDVITLGQVSEFSNKNRKEMSDQELTELVEHEIIHSYTAAYIAKELIKPETEMNSAVLYVKKSVEKLATIRDRDKLDFVDTTDKYESITKHNGETYEEGNALSRIDYILTKKTEVERIAEFIAVMEAEPQTRGVINMHFSAGRTNSALYSKIRDIIKYIKNFLIPNEPLKAVHARTLKYALENVVASGKNYKFNNYKEAMKLQKKAYGGKLGAGYIKRGATPLENMVTSKINMLNEAAYTILTSRIDNNSKLLSKNLDKWLVDTFPMYSDARDAILKTYKSTTALVELVHYMNLDSFKNKDFKQKVLSMMHNIKETRNSMENKQLGKISDLTTDFTVNGKKVLYKLVKNIPLHTFFMNDSSYSSKEDVASKIKELTAELGEGDLARIDDTVSLLVNRKPLKNSMYNIADVYDINSKVYKKVSELVMLKALEKSELVSELFNLKDNHIELYNIIKDNSLALSLTTNNLLNMDLGSKGISNTLVKDVYDTPIEYKIITTQTVKRYEYTEGTGWEVIRQPKDGQLGIAYRKVYDESFIEGAGVSDDILASDITVPRGLALEHIEDPSLVKSGEITKLILTQEEKVQAGLREDLGDTLVRSAAHTLATKDSQVVRNAFLEPGIRSVISSNEDAEIANIVDRIEHTDIDHPWFIKLDKDVKFNELPQEIRDVYKPIQQPLTALEGFNDKVSLVRKDIRPWLIGGHSKSLFSNPKLQRVSKVVKELVSATKIGMVIANPKKIIMDIISNTTQLSMLGVPLTKSIRYGKDIVKSTDSFNKELNNLHDIKLRYVANPSDKLKVQFDRAKARAKEHELYTAYENGFINSLSSDILNNSVDTISGLQADIKKVFEYLTTRSANPEQKNVFHDLLANASKFGFDGEDMLRGVGRIVGTMNTDGEIEEFLNRVADRIKKIKSNDDMVNYLSQFVLSPNSELVKAGTWVNDIADMTARETYRRHLVDIGVNKQEAIIKATEMLPFYIQNPPIAVKMLSDYGILMFPSFFLRTIRPIGHLAKRRAVSIGLEQEAQLLLGHHIETILDGNIVEKLGAGLLHSPTDYIGIDGVLPTNILNFY